MKIEAVDLFYLAMPEVKDIGDGSQDALLVRVRGGGLEGWGECEASPLVSIANYVCPMSHAACKPVRASVLGATIDSPADLRALSRRVRAAGLDIAQTDHTLSGIDIALWDLLGKARGEPVWKLLGCERAYAKRPYASALFGETPEQTHAKAVALRGQPYTAVKFGWGPYGTTDAATDAEHVAAARAGLGPDAMLLIDAGTVWVDDVGAARARLAALKQQHVTWLEEPFVSGALGEYAALAKEAAPVRLAGGEGAHNYYMARQMIDHAGLGFVQIDTGRIGGITTAHAVAQYAAARGVTYVNHTFTTHLALSASLQPFAGLAEATLCEYPVEATPLARTLTHETLALGNDGLVRVPDAPGLGVSVNLETVRQYLVETEIKAAGRVLYRTPTL